MVADDCIRNIGKTNGVGKITVKLSDLIKSLDVLECIGLDITGNSLTVAPREAFYSTTKYKAVKANNITLKSDVSNVYNKIVIGYDTKENTKDTNLTYPFNCKKTYEVINNNVENELNLLHPFIGDCYAIDDHFLKIFNETTNSDKSEICVIACEPAFTFDAGDILDSDSSGEMDAPIRITEPIILNVNASVTIGAYVSTEIGVATFRYTAPIKGIYNFTVNTEIAIDNASVQMEFAINSDTFAPLYTLNTRTDTSSLTSIARQFTVALNADDDLDLQILAFGMIGVDSDVQILSLYMGVGAEPVNTIVYKDHIITSDFEGDKTSVYNIPITPQRLLDKHLKYISVSNYLNPSDEIYFVSSELKGSITSQCEFETSSVTENADVVVPETPIFLPTVISFDTQEQMSTLSAIQSNKYKYIEIEDEKSGKIYTGWINNITFAVGKNKSQQWELQSRTI